ncbi:MAG: hypothetical protein QM579_02710 [Desulfovibrio sp.]|uniref:hypothetical protein n=1 Tax=Desulfovibrio sp. TaxID=885 RepID=UPI0039E5C1AF
MLPYRRAAAEFFPALLNPGNSAQIQANPAKPRQIENPAKSSKPHQAVQGASPEDGKGGLAKSDSLQERPALTIKFKVVEQYFSLDNL